MPRVSVGPAGRIDLDGLAGDAQTIAGRERASVPAECLHFPTGARELFSGMFLIAITIVGFRHGSDYEFRE
jgi:hypothetical protein